MASGLAEYGLPVWSMAWPALLERGVCRSGDNQVWSELCLQASAGVLSPGSSTERRSAATRRCCSCNITEYVFGGGSDSDAGHGVFTQGLITKRGIGGRHGCDLERLSQQR